MSLTLTTYPVATTGLNLLPGNSPIEIKFKREDLAVITTEIGASNTVIMNVATNVTASLNVGEFVHLNSGIYNVTAEVLEVSATQIRIDTQWLGSGTSGGYVNYKQNWYIELDIIDTDNDAIKILPFTLRDDGDNEGNITIDLSIINDLNELEFPDFSAANEMADSRVKFDIKYREVWRESSTTYVRITDPIIIYPAKDAGTIEDFNNIFDEPEYYVGYPNGAVFLHSDEDPLAADNVNFYYDEKDINGNVIKANNLVGSVASSSYGRLFMPLYNLSLLSNTEFIELRALAEAIPEFSPDDFTNDFNIG